MIAVELSFKQLIEAVKQLSVSEKTKLNEILWKDDLTIPAEQQSLVRARRTKAIENPSLLLDFESAIGKLK